jgi:adenylylsulfate kinase
LSSPILKAGVKHQPLVVWFSGLSGSGKTTLASHLELKLSQKGFGVYVLDGDVLRTGLNSDLGFTDRDRSENIRRAAEVASILAQTGLVVLATFISPFEKDRNNARQIVGLNFIEIFVDCPLEVCEKRDTKGLYKRARGGLIKNFTGIDSNYERPSKPEIIVKTDILTLEESVNFLENEILAFLRL